MVIARQASPRARTAPRRHTRPRVQVEASPEAAAAIDGEAEHRPPQHSHLLLEFSGIRPEDVLHPEGEAQLAQAAATSGIPGAAVAVEPSANTVE